MSKIIQEKSQKKAFHCTICGAQFEREYHFEFHHATIHLEKSKSRFQGERFISLILDTILHKVVKECMKGVIGYFRKFMNNPFGSGEVVKIAKNRLFSPYLLP